MSEPALIPVANSLEETTSLKWRLAVLAADREKRTRTAVISLSQNEQGGWTLCVEGHEEAPVEKLRTAVERFAEANRKVSDQTEKNLLPPKSKDLICFLADEGIEAEEIPPGDVQVSFQVDYESGRVVGTQTAIHALAGATNPLGRRVFETIVDGFHKASEDLANQIEGLVASNDLQGVLNAIRQGYERTPAVLRPNQRLLEVLCKIDPACFAADDRRLVRDYRLLVAQILGRFDHAGSEADAILSEDTDKLDREEIATLKMTAGLGALTRGNKETALSIWRGLLQEPSDLTAEGRGWAWRNISHTLANGDPEARTAARLSADSFLEAGNKTEAGKSLGRVATLLMKEDPAKAAVALDEMISVLDKEGLTNRYVRGSALHARGDRLAALGDHMRAYSDALEAVELQRGLLGAEAQFVSSLYLAALEAGRVGEIDAAGRLEAEAKRLTDELKISHFQMAERAQSLAVSFDKQTAEELKRDAEAGNNLEIIAGTRILQAMSDDSLSDIQKLELLEDTLKRVKAARGRKPMLDSVRLAIGRQLALMNQPKRAVQWFKELLNSDPFDVNARNFLIECLWKMEEWGDAAKVLREQLQLRGDLPGLLFAYGKSLFEAGDLSSAVAALTKSLARSAEGSDLMRNAGELRDRALQLGGTVPPLPPPERATGPVTREEFETALADFAHFASAVRRMTFWRKGKEKDHSWISKPEAHAQNLLHAYFDARFGDRVDIFEELPTGAGRIDLYVKLIGGLSFIIELKMCGFGYAASYAAAGEGQLLHYMENRKTALGYLLVFDARLDGFGAGLISSPVDGKTVIERFIDVRPRLRL